MNLNLGRKLAATGAGRGNLTNTNINPGAYDGFNEFSYSGLIQKYDYNFLVDYFKNIGIYTYHTDDGWVYPLSNSAKNISEYLMAFVRSLNIKLINESRVISITQELNN